jgi:hypothetical protein
MAITTSSTTTSSIIRRTGLIQVSDSHKKIPLIFLIFSYMFLVTWSTHGPQKPSLTYIENALPLQNRALFFNVYCFSQELD